MISNSDHIKSCIGRFVLWRGMVNTGNVSAFHRLSETLDDESVNEELKKDIGEHFSALEREIQQYFPGINIESGHHTRPV